MEQQLLKVKRRGTVSAAENLNSPYLLRDAETKTFVAHS